MGGGESNPAAGEPSLIDRRELFISYSHKDLHWLQRLRVHLKPLEKQYSLERWDDSRLQAGDLWREEIKQALARAKVALLLVSPDFLASDFIDGVELPPLFQAAKEKGLRILWIPLRPSRWKKHPEIVKYQAIIPTNTTLAQMSDVDQDLAMLQIVEKIEDAFDQIEAQREAQQKAAEAEIGARREDEQRRRAQHEALRKQLEDARVSHFKAEDGARTEETERLRADYQELQREYERLKQQTKQPRMERLQRADISISPEIKYEPALIQIPVNRGWLVQEGNKLQKKREPISRSGHLQELAEEIAITMLHIPAGEFQMGSPGNEENRNENESPQHLVQLQSFFLAQNPVTQAQWKVVADWPKVGLDLNQTPSHFKVDNRPVERVSWEEAMEFCQRLSQRTKLAYTLPSEAQWEYACRAKTTSVFAFGESLSPDIANYDGNYRYGSGPTGVCRNQTTDVSYFLSNAWGLQDMHGNVSEWCLDHWHENYKGAPSDGTSWVNGSEEKGDRVLRGGSWLNFPWSCRSAYRGRRRQSYRDHDVGFRLCRLPQGLTS